MASSTAVAHLFLLSNDIVQTQSCSKCKLYLSRGPVKTYENNKVFDVRCGRCTQKNDGGVSSLFNIFVANALFPCINRFQGCDVLLKHSDTEVHEQSCVGYTYLCPICLSSVEYQVLQLIDHFNTKHWNNISNGGGLFKLGQEDIQVLLYYDLDRNVFSLIKLDQNDRTINIFVGETLKLKQRITIYNSLALKEQHEIFKTDFIITEGRSTNIAVPKNLLNISEELYLKLEVETLTQRLRLIRQLKDDNTKSIQFIRGQRYLPARRFPQLHIDKLFEKKIGKNYLRNYDVSEDGLNIIDHDTKTTIAVSCYYCENFLACCGDIKKIYFCASCSYSLCGVCHMSGVDTRCPRCGELNIKLSSELARHYYLHFYCGFKCGRFFRGWDLLKHEEQCELNERKGLTDKQYVQLYFGEEKKENDRFLRTNRILVDESTFSGKGKLYVVTRDDHRFIVEFESELRSRGCKLSVIHNYDDVNVITKVCEDEEYYKSGSNFFISFNDLVKDSKCFQFFVVIFNSK